MSFGPLELFIVLLIVVVLFGAGRISGIGRELRKCD
ncbi:MAG UNVERIFIED_CONTAM: twin-arginine translocase TatA/TatE family subunit [Anaerolineae bacterium]